MRALVLLLALVAVPVGAQTQQVLFPGQSGADLRASLRAQYRPSSTSGNNDDLYSTVERTMVGSQEGVVCVYTGLFVPFDGNPSSDPSQDVGNGFQQNGESINQEHTWPNSLISGIADDDLHNLFPTQVGVNSDRGTFRFADIPDTQTNRWYRGTPPYTQTTPPSANIDEYSEFRNGQAFEPREDHKGDVARALFYMDTMYDTQTSGNFPFDQAQQETLYDWHYADPITAENQARSARVAPFQNGKDNPFVLDSTLVRRAFFPDIVIVSDEAAPAAPGLTLRRVGAHPFREAGRLAVDLPHATAVRAELFDALGRRVAVLHDGSAPAGTLALSIDGARLAPGVYHATVRTGDAVITTRVVRLR